MSEAGRAQHRAFLNAYYGRVKHVYDVSRRYYLFGRDPVLSAIAAESWETLVEVGPGTGRNLRRLYRAQPDRRYGAIDASDEMLSLTCRRCPFARVAHGFAEDADYLGLFGARPDRILFSYCLSMVQRPAQALVHARRSLAPNGKLVVVDFGDMQGLSLLSAPMRRFLHSFHVVPPDAALLRAQGAQLRHGPGNYYVVAVMSAAEAEAAP